MKGMDIFLHGDGTGIFVPKMGVKKSVHKLQSIGYSPRYSESLGHSVAMVGFWVYIPHSFYEV